MNADGPLRSFYGFYVEYFVELRLHDRTNRKIVNTLCTLVPFRVFKGTIFFVVLCNHNQCSYREII